MLTGTFRLFGPRVRALVVGPSSAGKSHLASCLGRATGLPVVIEDASAICEHGWEGRQVADVAASALAACNYDVAALEHGGVLLVLDEVDKATVVRRERDGEDVDPRGSAVRASRQAAMLQLLWGETPIRCKGPLGEQLAVHTDRWAVLAFGAFAGAEWARPSAVITDDHLVRWGMSPQFAARLTQRWVLEPRSVADVARILQTSRDGVSGLRGALSGLGFALEVEPAAVGLLARQVIEENLTLRTAAGRLIDVVLDRLVAALDAGTVEQWVVRVRPDDLVQSAGPGAAPNDWHGR
jgi:ATP-dependent Clp protease ATP-binding subunit ClpX